MTVVREAYLTEISTLKVDDLVQAMGASGISKSQVSKLCGEFHEQVKEFLGREITGEWPYPWLGATSLKSRENRHVVSLCESRAWGTSARSLALPLRR